MTSLSFEKALADLEAIVEKLEKGGLSLNESLALFEKGVKLAKFLRDELGKAEKKVEILLKDKKDEKGDIRAEKFSLETEERLEAQTEEDESEEEGDEEDEETKSYQAEEKLDAEALRGNYPVSVRFGDLMPMDEQAMMLLASQARQPGVNGLPLLSDVTILEKYKIAEDPAVERDRILYERAQNSPEILGLETQILIAMAREELKDRMAELDIDFDAALLEVQAGQAMTAPPQELQIPAQLGPEQMPPQQGLPPEIMPQAMQEGGAPPALPPEIAAQLGVMPGV